MIKWICRVVLFLMLGAVVNVAVAWGCAIARGDPSAGSRPMRYEGHGFRQIVITARGVGSEYMIELPFGGDGHILQNRRTYHGRTWWSDDPPISADLAAHIGCGWPMLALSARARPAPASAVAEQRSIVIEDGFVLGAKALNPPRDESLPVVLPYRPIWLGFAVNTGGYCCALLAVFVIPGAIRRLVRRWRGRCPTCGYPRGESRLCSECGQQLPNSLGERRHGSTRAAFG